LATWKVKKFLKARLAVSLTSELEHTKEEGGGVKSEVDAAPPKRKRSLGIEPLPRERRF